MLNQVIIVGRLVATPEVKDLEEERSVANITVAVPRAFKNADGEYETDFIDCELWNAVANNTAEYCKKGDVIGVKGRLKTEVYTKDDGTTAKITKVIAERITFLSSKKENED